MEQYDQAIRNLNWSTAKELFKKVAVDGISKKIRIFGYSNGIIKRNKKMQEITIVVDTNNADYITAITEINDEDLEIIKPLVATIKEFKPYSGNTENGLSWGS